MKKILFFAQTYWEIHWLYRVVKAIYGVIYANTPPALEAAKSLQLNTTTDLRSGDILVTCIYHMGENYKAIDKYKAVGKDVILLQHAWDSQIQCFDKFWGLKMDLFDVYFTGCTQDKEWISDIHGKDKVFNPGIPRLDDVFKVKNSKDSLKDIYQEIGHDKFYLADIPPSQIYSNEVENAYLKQLPQESPLPIVYKMHPGGNYRSGNEWLKKHGPNNIIFLDDDINDPLRTYQLMKASSGVINLESFLSIEATLLEKPVIFYAYKLLPDNYFESTDRIGYSHRRLPKGMGSAVNNPQFTAMQKKVASWYNFDGKNTDRVVELLELACNLN